MRYFTIFAAILHLNDLTNEKTFHESLPARPPVGTVPRTCAGRRERTRGQQPRQGCQRRRNQQPRQGRQRGGSPAESRRTGTGLAAGRSLAHHPPRICPGRLYLQREERREEQHLRHQAHAAVGHGTDHSPLVLLLHARLQQRGAGVLHRPTRDTQQSPAHTLRTVQARILLREPTLPHLDGDHRRVCRGRNLPGGMRQRPPLRTAVRT